MPKGVPAWDAKFGGCQRVAAMFLRERCGRLEAEPAEARHQADAAAAWNFELLAAEIDTLRAENAALRAAQTPID